MNRCHASTSLLAALLLSAGLAVPGLAAPQSDEPFAIAESRAEIARQALRRARGVLTGWWGLRDPITGLLPRRTDQAVWAPGDNAADLMPFLILTARFTAPELRLESRELFRQEVQHTTRVGFLPDWYSIEQQRFLHDQPDAERIIFGATEYAKDGLNPLIELLGPDPWRHRMAQLLDGVLEQAPVRSDFGLLPSASAEVNGELLQTLTRFFFLTGEEKYLEAAERIGDAYCLEVLPRGGDLPAHRWDFDAHRAVDDRLNLNDHGNEIIGGLAELYLAVAGLERPSGSRYRRPLTRMFDRLLEVARNPDGLWFGLLEASTGRVLRDATPDTWGYGLTGVVTFGMATGEPRYARAARLALRNIHQERYLDWGGADSFADSIEGALLLLNRFPEPAGFAWLDAITPAFFARQKLPEEGGTGIVEGWYGDGNYARTALMLALFHSQGAFVEPWNESLLLGATSHQDRLVLSLRAGSDWSGTLHLDHARHRDHFRLPRNHPRLNEFPEWYTVDPGLLYEVERRDPQGGVEVSIRSGAEWISGVPFELDAGESLRLVVRPAPGPPYGQEVGPSDPFRSDGQDDRQALDAIRLEGDGSWAGEAYRWVGASAIEWTVAEQVTRQDATLWLRWGAKGDLRGGRLLIGDRQLSLRHGGYDGFDWLAVDIPEDWWGGAPPVIRLESDRAGLADAFVAAMRLHRLAARPADGALLHTIEAEEFDGGWAIQRNVPGYSGRGFRTSNADGVSATSLSAGIDLPAGGYDIWVRGYEGNGQDRRFAVELAGLRLAPTHRERHSGRFRWQLAGRVTLAGGPQQVRIHDLGIGPEVVDALLFSSDPTHDPGVLERLERPVFPTASLPDLTGAIIAQCVSRAERSHAAVRAMQEDRQDWEEHRQGLRRELRAALGLEPLPERTPLNVRFVAAVERSGYRIEKLVFDSRPGFPVTANLYLPTTGGDSRRPAVLCPLGHWGRSKAEPVVQARCIALAKQGVIVLTYDPFGQGERDVAGNGHHQAFAASLVGQHNLSFMVWDTLRALDLLLERDDVDPERIGCTGASGGGLNTLYAAALDERIGVAVPVVYVTRFREFMETRRGHCPCSHVPGLLASMDMGDVLALIAPRPVMLITAGRDPDFTPAGAQAAMEQARPAWDLLGQPDRLVLREFDAGHDYDRPMRQAMYGFLGRFGFGTGGEEPDWVGEEPEVLNCFASGRVPDSARTVRSLLAARARSEPMAGPTDVSAWVGAGEPGVTVVPADASRERIRRRLLEASGKTPEERRRFVLGDEIALDVTGVSGGNPDGPELIWLTSDLPAVLASPAMVAVLSQVCRVHVLDPAGVPLDGQERQRITDSLLLGDALLLRRVRALRSWLQWLRRQGPAERVLIAGADGLSAALPLLLAQSCSALVDGISVADLPPDLAKAIEAGAIPAALAAWNLVRETGGLSGLLESVGVPVRIVSGPDGGGGLAAWVARLSSRNTDEEKERR